MSFKASKSPSSLRERSDRSHSERSERSLSERSERSLSERSERPPESAANDPPPNSLPLQKSTRPMTKIDLSGKGGWQSKAGDKMKALEKGGYNISTIELNPDDLNSSWLTIGNMVKLIKGQINLKVGEEEYAYEEGEIIIVNETNLDAEILISGKVVLELFEEKQ